ncbi:class I SAM-dependent methyltransferase [Hymenobacter sp. BT664]|uniref:Class I SAM-dependent methyltransferase n=1 Tax=Hymenobacter montanus TaxID=2771359 RepID=A0A927BAB8_9BACT|nr:class I SAM-dependent methyltransferase [Hymenobacter montanus]MBD2766786.1 class I SAM-dependent methyltransferase [Hymenobacter montanus]
MTSPVTAAPAPPRYQPAQVRALFDAMALTYGWGGWLSGGLLKRWRRRLAQALRGPATGPVWVVDLMAGGADLWPALHQRFGPRLRLAAVDFSAPMLARAAAHGAGGQLDLYHADALATPLPAGQATVVTCAFGLKTLLPAQYPALTAEAARLLRPGGEVALVEFVLPDSGWRRRLAQQYMALLMPLLGWLQPAARVHAELPLYASAGPDWPALGRALRQMGFRQVRQRRLWPGYAVLITAVKPG